MPEHLEPLELRRLLTIPISGGVLNLTDNPDLPYITSGSDVLEIRLNGSTIEVRSGSGALLDSHAAAGVTGININAGAGNDIVRIGTISGGSMPHLPVTLHGGAGNDSLTGGNSDDQLFGDAGNDRLDGRAGRDLMDGGADFDTVDYSYRTGPIHVTLANSSTANDGSSSGNNSSPTQDNDLGGDNARNVEGVIGGNGADVLSGSSSANWIDGGGGNDLIFGGDGIDTIVGGVNADTAYGQNDDDFFFFQDSIADQFLGGPGTTTAEYDAKLDTPAPALPSPALVTLAANRASPLVDRQLSARDVQNFPFVFADPTLGVQPLPAYLVQRVQALKPDGTFEISGTPFNDVIKVTEKNGVITASINGFLWQETAVDVTKLLVHLDAGNDRLIIDPSVRVPVEADGDAGDDTVVGSPQSDTFFGGDGDDVFIGQGGNDSVSGDAGNDILLGGAGQDTLAGGDGKDLLIGGRGADSIQTGSGNDFNGDADGISNAERLFLFDALAKDWSAPLRDQLRHVSLTDLTDFAIGENLTQF